MLNRKPASAYIATRTISSADRIAAHCCNPIRPVQMPLQQHTNSEFAVLRVRVRTELLQLQSPPAACTPGSDQGVGEGPDAAGRGAPAGSKRQMQS